MLRAGTPIRNGGGPARRSHCQLKTGTDAMARRAKLQAPTPALSYQRLTAGKVHPTEVDHRML